MRALLKANAALVSVGLATFVLMGAGQALYGPVLPPLTRQLGLTPAEAGLLVSAHWMGCVAGVGLMYFHAARLTPRYVIGAIVAGTALIGIGPGYWGTVLGAAVFGMGYGGGTAIFNPRILRAFGAHGTAMLGVLNAVFAMGAIASPLLYVALGSRPGLTFAVVAALAAAVWLGAGPAGRSGLPMNSAAPLPFRPRFGILVLGMLAIGAEASMVGLGPTALIRAGTGETQAAQLLSMFFIALMLARLSLIALGHRIPSFTLYIIATGGTAICFALATLLPPALFFVAAGAFTGLFFPGYFVTATRVMGDDPRVAPTIVIAGLTGGIGLPVTLGWAMAGAGERGLFWMLGGLCLALTLAALLLRRGLEAQTDTDRTP